MTELRQKHSQGETVSILLGAAFLMATSAIGPGFITQTTVFTERLKAAFAFAIVVSILVDIVVQLNVWRILAVSGLRGQDVANRVLPGLGYFLAFAVALGGLAFNIGNVGGAALGCNVLLGVDQTVGAVASALVAIAIFLWRDLGKAMDRFTQVLGFVMIAMIAYVVFKTNPPAAESVREIVTPSVVDWTTILTLVGGTVGGYITFSGAHRIIDAGITGTENIARISRGSVNGIFITGVMRFLLFLAVLGVVVTGVKLDPSNPAADAFRIAAGEVGYKIFGVILWSAAITSVVGCSYTSVSFLRTLFGLVERHYRFWIIGFILASTTILTWVGRPVTLLILAGSINGMILPLSLASMLLAAHRKDIMGEYRHPVWLTALGWVMVVFTAWMGWGALMGLSKLFS
ncbi:NRAMP family divalent metal transporter [Fretibacterium sp. OH1220_COT-178]|uniref:NRAMP family divalent metal transporter n=1 Tax=Fretibacterium sp. OH1220_COT-178 TaxID=2491047 RepID=UPI000F5E74EC|nr:NRAMP family divalent metal transporter [Fretibacterium sp. OH1220_COT-178]RRD65376.1 divalent metal cation transporter [Fretibacterium sp. OH1220_COT-178]